MQLRQFQVNAFTDQCFSGNPAAVVPLERWLDAGLLQAIAHENNLSETAFFVPEADGFALRWFTPTQEVDLCGHATLAAAHVLLECLGHSGEALQFSTRSGCLTVRRQGERLQLDLPMCVPLPCAVPAGLADALGQVPLEVLSGHDYIVVLESADVVQALRPSMALLMSLDLDGVIVTAPGSDCDFVSRYFVPKQGIPEDPVTGSAHCQLAPFWGGRLGKQRLNARQLSQRGGQMACELAGDRVLLSGSAVLFMDGTMHLS
jgi:PhzF family phenazine biosynthesis protein